MVHSKRLIRPLLGCRLIFSFTQSRASLNSFSSPIITITSNESISYNNHYIPSYSTPWGCKSRCSITMGILSMRFESYEDFTHRESHKVIVFAKPVVPAARNRFEHVVSPRILPVSSPRVLKRFLHRRHLFVFQATTAPRQMKWNIADRFLRFEHITYSFIHLIHIFSYKFKVTFRFEKRERCQNIVILTI